MMTINIWIHVMATKLHNPNFNKVQYHFKGSGPVQMLNQRYEAMLTNE